MLEIHPIADIFPMMDQQSKTELLDSIADHGQDDEIVLYQGMILDGRNRAECCEILKIEPKTTEYVGTDPVGFSFRKNFNRRHLSSSQRAMVAAKMANLNHGDSLNRGSQTANLQDGVTRADAAQKVNVSERSVNTAKKVLNEADQEVVSAVENGDMSVSAAADIVHLPKEEQRAIINSDEPLHKVKKVRESNIVLKEHEGCKQGVLERRTSLQIVRSTLDRGIGSGGMHLDKDNLRRLVAELDCVLNDSDIWDNQSIKKIIANQQKPFSEAI